MSDHAKERAASDQAVLVVDQLYQAFRRRDLQALGVLLDQDVQVAWNGRTKLASWRGRVDVLSALARSVKDSGGTAVVIPIAVYAGSDTPVVVVQQEFGHWNRAAFDQSASVIFDLENGVITRITRVRSVDANDSQK